MDTLLFSLQSLTAGDLPNVGAKSACIGELHRLGLATPAGYALGTAAFARHLDQAGVRVEPGSATHARRRILETPLCDEIGAALTEVARKLPGGIAVRSSLFPFEDDPRHSCAGLFESHLNLTTPRAVSDAVRSCFASAFSPEALAYYDRHGLDVSRARMAVSLQETVLAEASATVFSRDPITMNPDVMHIDAAHGFGGVTNSGLVESDSCLVAKQPDPRIIARRKGLKLKRLRVDDAGGLVLVPNTAIGFAIDDAVLLRIAADVQRCEAARGCAVDVELAVTRDGEVVYLQLRAQAQIASVAPTAAVDVGAGILVADGTSVAFGVGAGRLTEYSRSTRAAAGTVVIAEEVAVADVPKLGAASALVVRHLPPTSHPAIHLREVGVPTLAVGSHLSTVVELCGQNVTVDCSQEQGALYDSGARVVPQLSSGRLPVPEVEMCLIASYPSVGWLDFLPSSSIDGVHVRGESIIYDDVRVHPLALVAYDEHQLDGQMRALVERKVAGYPGGQSFYVAKFAERLGTMRCSVPSHQAVTLRLSDLQASDYRQLVGGALFESEENNPMLGLRGAARLIHRRFILQLRLELEGVRRARESVGGAYQVLVPMVRDRAELAVVREVMGEVGLDVPLGTMVETVAAVLQAQELAELVDFFVVGPADLAQAVNSADRDHNEVQQYADPRNLATMRAMELLLDRLEASDKSVYVPASHYVELRERCGDRLSHKLRVFTWPDRYLAVATQLEAECGRRERAAV